MGLVSVKLTDGTFLEIEKVVSIIVKEDHYLISTSKREYLLTKRNVFYVRSEGY
jgi:hypothetical protein